MKGFPRLLGNQTARNVVIRGKLETETTADTTYLGIDDFMIDFKTKHQRRQQEAWSNARNIS